MLVNNPNGSFLSSDHYTLDVLGSLSHFLQFRMQYVSRFNCCLCVEFRRVANLEKNVFHNIAAIWPLELEWFAFEQDVVEAPCLRCQHRRKPDLSFFHEKSEVYGT